MGIDLIYGLLPEHILLTLILALMVLESLRVDRQWAGPLFTFSLVAGCLVLCQQIGEGYAFGLAQEEIAVDRPALLARLAVLGCGLILGLCFHERFASYKSRLLLSCSLLGGLLMMGSTSFITLFIGIEMLSLPAFALMLHGGGEPAASEGAFKYLVLSSVATACLLFGASLSYHATGSLALSSLSVTLGQGAPLMYAAAALVAAGLFMKAAVFPFHGWAPDAYGSAQLPVTAFLASVIKAAVILVLARVFSRAGSDPLFGQVIAVLGVLSVCYGNLTAIRQSSFRKLLAYSSIAHAGYMVFALADNGGAALETLLYYASLYAVTTVLACACFASLAGSGPDEIASVEGSFHARPVPAVILSLALLSLAGIPPLPGFFAKLFVFRSLIASGYLVPAVAALFGSYLGVFYYLRMVFLLFKPVSSPSPALAGGSTCWTRCGMLVAAGVLIYFVVSPHGLSLAPARTAQTSAAKTVACVENGGHLGSNRDNYQPASIP
ncbi:NADH-quinone oxidoreductase subunit N [Geomonas sp.]|uniref:NADH-quinone oxidoreductase subunit N n=1 Tax=Geomonas sp. TaxID=2651584 RepID=UPI002B463257|nr:proton-conducting transporter membrane subunit [Geomonas sp.]HJV35105.1 proton-conducting transporter membrane subunit [Geomonas sp.]